MYYKKLKNIHRIERTIRKLVSTGKENDKCGPAIKENIQALSEHACREYNDGTLTSEFMSTKDKMGDNRDCTATAFTTGPTLQNGDLVSLVVYWAQNIDGTN